jgi:osmotically-inducible protein OsmY
MKSDNQIQQDVIDQLKWEPFLNATEIDVAVTDGIVTLSGNVNCYAKKLSAENAAKKIECVKAIATDIQINVFTDQQKSDKEIAAAVINALKWHAAINEEIVTITVEDGSVKLEGKVECGFERTIAKMAIENIAGVRSIVNLLTITPSVLPVDVEQKIKAAFHRSATIDAARIRVEVDGNAIVLHGKVRSIAEKEDAENAVWNAPGITSVENKLKVDLHIHEHTFVD